MAGKEFPPAKEILPVDDIRISGHALQQFMIRADTKSLTEAVVQIRTRFSEAVQVIEHPSITNDKLVTNNNIRLYFQDPFDPDLLYAVYKKAKGRYVMVSVLKPLDKSLPGSS